MIKSYNPNITEATHTVRITLMQWDYIGHISRMVDGNCKGAELLNVDCFECDNQEDIDNYVENDCKLSYDEDYDIYTVIFTKPSGRTLTIVGDEGTMKKMVVSIEFSEVVEETDNE